jgi:hypothetical protein
MNLVGSFEELFEMGQRGLQDFFMASVFGVSIMRLSIIALILEMGKEAARQCENGVARPVIRVDTVKHGGRSMANEIMRELECCDNPNKELSVVWLVALYGLSRCQRDDINWTLTV